jgi:hypothetical protein
MRLLRRGPYEPGHEKLELIEEFGQDIPRYAILSHTWGRDEVTFEHVRNGTAHEHKAYDKVISAMRQAALDGHAYIWIDSCCIDKTSSAELSEAINSMYSWYQKAEVCYAILEDVPNSDDVDFETRFVASRWFTRGWTLQELLAPRRVDFFARGRYGRWISIGNRESLSSLISTSTTIAKEYLEGVSSDKMREASVAQKMSWAARRQTRREEDIAYCLMGLFSVNMPLLYGEGPRAFMRLQDEIMKISDDQTIFAWTHAGTPTVEAAACHNIIEVQEVNVNGERYEYNGPGIHVDSKESLTGHGLLADNPAAFLHSGGYVPWKHPFKNQVPYQMTNRGLSMSLHFPPLRCGLPRRHFVADLQCTLGSNADSATEAFVGVLLYQTMPHLNQYTRVRCDVLVKYRKSGQHGPGSRKKPRQILVRQARA